MKKKINRKKAVNSMTQKSVHIKKRKIKNIKTQKRKCANNRKSKIKIYIACLLSSFKQKCEYAFQGTDVKDETSLSGKNIQSSVQIFLGETAFKNFSFNLFI